MTLRVASPFIPLRHKVREEVAHSRMGAKLLGHVKSCDFKREKKKAAVLRGCQIGLVSGPTVCAEVRVQTCLSQCSAPTHCPLPEELLRSVKFPSPPLVHEEQPDLPE